MSVVFQPRYPARLIQMMAAVSVSLCPFPHELAAAAKVTVVFMAAALS